MILIGLGANLDSIYGSPEETILKAISLFDEYDISVIAVSSIWKSAPVPLSDQPWYKNAVCLVDTNLCPYELLSVLSKIEGVLGRTRRLPNEARVLDLDLLSYNDVVIDDKNLNLPHPRMSERAFVLYPLQEIAPKWLHPKSGKTVSELIKLLPKDQEIEKISKDRFEY